MRLSLPVGTLDAPRSCTRSIGDSPREVLPGHRLGDAQAGDKGTIECRLQRSPRPHDGRIVSAVGQVSDDQGPRDRGHHVGGRIASYAAERAKRPPGKVQAASKGDGVAPMARPSVSRREQVGPA